MDSGRIVRSALAARRSHERALHDGVQQDLIAAGIRLQLARELVANNPAAATVLLDALRDDLHEALDRVRGLADDIYPSTLDARGLGDALRPLGVTTEGVERYPETIEAAVYFSCRMLHATAGSLRDDGTNLVLEVNGADATDEARDLVEAVGGTLAAARGRITATFPRDTGSQP